MILGIDPGWASCGFALMDSSSGDYGEGAGLIMRDNFVPRDHSDNGLYLEPAVTFIDKSMADSALYMHDVGSVYIERFVAYKGINSSASEDILMFIGALRMHYEDLGIPVHMVRAIDWKPKVCKYLMRTKGFNNPYSSFDKKFSILAAKTLSGWEFDNDHAADAVCLSYLLDIDEWNKENGK